ncbi:hypothetical protein F4781DRAFT_35927 [Annulohypoxylon bovei var. microspora]|nr:hypothetical protein F4781DRAFT_35927 [Annulohypoxylon bovei var. microspora]
MAILTEEGELVRVAGSSFEANGKFKIYSSKATPAPGDEIKVLDEGTGIDNFVSILTNQVLILKTPPTDSNLVVPFDVSDNLATWMQFLDPTADFSLSFDNVADKNIQSFEFHLTKPWELTFSSSAAALLFSFGPNVGQEGARVPAPGVTEEGKMLYFGLDSRYSNTATSTIKELFDFAGIRSSPPSVLADWTVSLEEDSSEPKRNALWFSPVNYYQSIMRLQFGLDATNTTQFQEFIADSLPSFKFEGVDVICKKVLTSAKSNGKPVAVDSGEVLIQAKCSITPKGKELKVTAGISFYSRRYDLTLMLDSDDALGVILEWLAELAGVDMSFIQPLLDDGGLFGENLFLRQIKISLEATNGGKKTKLSSFSLDIEAKATIGQAKDNPNPVVFLLNYSWRENGAKWGSIKGSLWNYFDLLPDRDLRPGYELTSNLVPRTIDAAKTLSIISMIPDVTVENVPENIPTEISRAYIVLNQDSMAIGGTVQSKDFDANKEYPVPQLDLGAISIDGSYSWKTKKATLSVGIMVEMKPSVYSKHQDTAILAGSVEYDSGTGKWLLGASLNGLYLSTLYEFFDKSSGEGDHAIPLIESIEVESMNLVYKYEKTEASPPGRASGSEFTFDGLLKVDVLQLKFSFVYENKAWKIEARLDAGSPTTIGKILRNILGDQDLDIPGFLDDAALNPDKDKIELAVEKGPAENGGSGSFQFMTTLVVTPGDFQITLTFAQLHGKDWPADSPSKRLVKVALTAVPAVDIPLVGNLTQPFDEMYYMWIQDSSNQKKSQMPGLTRQDITDLNLNTIMKEHPLVAKDKTKTPNKDDLLLEAGSHLAIIIKDEKGVRECLLDYDFKRQAVQSQANKKKKQRQRQRQMIEAGDYLAAEGEEEKPESDGTNSSAPFKKKSGPLSISNIGLKYEDKVLHISFNATMELGPVGLSLLGFSLNLELTSLDLKQVTILPPSLEGFAVAFERKPLTIAGIIRHGQTSTLNYYAGGLIVGWTPYQLEAAGFYGEAKPASAAPFTSVFVFARLDGPLITLEFAEISGVTGGFGYKSEVRVPKAAEITKFPFIDQSQLGSAESALEALEKLTDPGAGGWFTPHDDTYWAAAGMKIDAFQMISLDAVVVVQFGEAIKLGIFGVALVDIPNTGSGFKLAHVELGIAVVVDFDYGIVKAEAQLSPKSYILDPNCHLTGGFALYYWFDAPHADHDNVGNFVFSLGGYHQAFDVPAGWPNPERLAISWNLGSNLSIAGEAYFAITPKVCMGGGRLRASFSAGPVAAWFDAFANFLINYKPFHFYSEAGICVGVSFNLDILFIHIHISAELSADLYLWGPPLAGKVHVDIKVAQFDISFGGSRDTTRAINLDEFYELVLQASSKASQAAALEDSRIRELAEGEEEAEVSNFNRKPDNQGHTFLAQTGLLNDSSNPSRDQNAPWVVRGGTFSFLIGCKMVIDDAKLVDDDEKELSSVTSKAGTIYAKPMRLAGSDHLDSNLVVKITQPEETKIWQMSQDYKSVPTGLWAEYHDRDDPSTGNNNIDDLLKVNDSGMRLMSGVLFMAPPPVMSQDRLPVFNIIDATLQQIDAEKGFPALEFSSPDWEPDQPTIDPSEQWTAVHDKWKTPAWNTDDYDDDGDDDDDAEALTEGGHEIKVEEDTRDVQKQFVLSWAEAFQWDSALSTIAQMPRMLDKRFNELFVAAPMMTTPWQGW